MKKLIFAVMFLLIGINAIPAYAQSTKVIRIDIPFAFNANNKTLPAGTYTINSAMDSRLMWRIQGDAQKHGAFLLAGNLTGAKEVGNVRLTFRRYGDRHFLIGFNTSSYQVELPTSKNEKDFRQTWDGLAKHDVVSIETVSKK